MTPAELIQQIDAHRFENISVLPSDTLSVPETEMDLFSHEILRILQDPAFDIAGFFPCCNNTVHPFRSVMDSLHFTAIAFC